MTTKTRDSQRYGPGIAGWMVLYSRPIGGKPGESYWCGPDIGWGSTYEGLGDQYTRAQVWPTKQAAIDAYRRSHGRRPSGYHSVVPAL